MVGTQYGYSANKDELSVLRRARDDFLCLYIRLQWMWSRYEGESEYLPVCVCFYKPGLDR